MSINKDDHEMHLVRDFIAENWASFTAFLEERGMTEDEADNVFQHIGGEE